MRDLLLPLVGTNISVENDYKLNCILLPARLDPHGISPTAAMAFRWPKIRMAPFLWAQRPLPSMILQYDLGMLPLQSLPSFKWLYCEIELKNDTSFQKFYPEVNY